MKRFAGATLGAVVLTLIGFLAPAQASQWVTLNQTGWVTLDPALTLGFGTPPGLLVTVQSNDTTNNHSLVVGIPLNLVDGAAPPTIDAVRVCYKTSNSASFIQGTGLFVYTSEFDGNIVPLDLFTRHDSTTYTCYTISGPPLPLAGALQLLLNVIFANTSHVISIGVVAVHFR